MGRLSHAEAILGKEVFAKARNTPVLVVGAGGIGCELLKNLVLVGFSNIEIIDLDTIDLSNLNRQFLFRKPDIGKSKSLVAAATARHFNPSSGINIHARHGNVKESENDVEWISKFGLVMNALDNRDARRHVNRLCQAAKVPLIESGTAGYVGQVMPIVSGVSECYDCGVKPAVKSYPVCTIRSTPSEPIHCIVWGKSYLFGKLFGEDDEELDNAELEKAKADGENAEEIEKLKEEAAAFRTVRKELGEEDGPQRVFRKVFHDDINRLLQMDDLWKVEGRIRPVPLDYDAIMDGSFVAPSPRTASTTAPATPAANGSTSVLKDQKELTLKENLELFVDACRRLSARAIAHPEIVLSFDKDDDDTLDFVLAVANLRATAYQISTRTRFQVKEMAGNIIPAIATTNAIIAGMVVMRALSLLKTNYAASRDVPLCNSPFLQPVIVRPLGSKKTEGPNPECAVCRDVYVKTKVDLSKCTLGDFLKTTTEWLAPVLGDDELEVTVLEGGRVLADPDFDDNHGRTLANLGIERGKMITFMDEDDKYRPIHFCIVSPDASGEVLTLPTEPPTLPPKPVKKALEPESEDEFEVIEAPAEAPPPATKKRAAENGEDEGRAKKRKVAKEPESDDDSWFEMS